jgi:hypothetical protein
VVSKGPATSERANTISKYVAVFNIVIDYIHSIYYVYTLVLNSSTENMCLIVGEIFMPLQLCLVSESG